MRRIGSYITFYIILFNALSVFLVCGGTLNLGYERDTAVWGIINLICMVFFFALRWKMKEADSKDKN